jgi:hypothetical protein
MYISNTHGSTKRFELNTILIQSYRCTSSLCQSDGGRGSGDKADNSEVRTEGSFIGSVCFGGREVRSAAKARVPVKKIGSWADSQ